MAKRSDRNLIVGLDIGTSKVVAMVGEIHGDGSLEVIGLGSHPSRGLKKGVVVNIDSTVQSIQRAVEEAELMAGVEIRSVFTGIAGKPSVLLGHIRARRLPNLHASEVGTVRIWIPDVLNNR
jgi:cell division protein FtsA